MNRRVLVTGSRAWPVTLIYLVNAVLEAEFRLVPPGSQLTVVHGDCPSGVDFFARQWCRRVNAYGTLPPVVNEERHPADWATCAPNCGHPLRTRQGKPYCPQAGHRRNQQMVDLGADIVHAFPVAGAARGTMDCVGRAQHAKLPVLQHLAALP